MTKTGEPVNDSTWQKQMGGKAVMAPIVNVEGSNNTSGVAPPDTQGDVGPNHYVQMVNLVTQIFNKSGASVWGPQPSSVFWDGFAGSWTGTNDGDPIVLYDQQADRWLVSQFAVNTNDNTQWELIAISTTGDPTGSYYRYAFQFTDMPDYPKIGIWPDGYYMSANRFGINYPYSYKGTYAAVYDRTAMLAGNSSAQMILFSNGTSTSAPYSMLPSDCDGSFPSMGTPNYFCFDNDNDTYWSADRVKVWAFYADWTTPSNSTFTQSASLTPASFNSSFSGSYAIDQPGTTQDLGTLADRMMFRAQYRTFSGHQSIVLSRTVNLGNDHAGVRWYELRNTGSGWSIYQQGTYAPDGNSRWMSSVAMNGNGDIALGYSVSGSSTYPSIRYSGRLAGDALGTMTIAESSIFSGTASQTGIGRWGDYSMMSVDPSDDQTFWYTQEYSSGGWSWRTRIASFQFTNPTSPPTANFSAADVTPNIGQTVAFTDASTNLPTSWFWSFSPSTITFVGGTNSSSQNPQVTFDALGTYTVSLVVTNAYGSDTETKTDYIEVAINYCVPSYTTGTSAGDYISLVQLGDIYNPTGALSSPYYYYYNSQSTDVAPGNSYDIIVSAGSYASGNNISVWIDFNHDGTFATSEKLGNVTLGAMPETGTINFSVPLTSVIGITRMRVREVWDNTIFYPCSSYSYGEAEDYNINIVSGDINLDITAFLEGPYNSTNMNTDINLILPTVQPFTGSPWNYSGSESVGSVPGTDIVDWILVELRDTTSASQAFPSTIIDSKACFIKSNGQVVDLSGNAQITFANTSVANNLFVVIFPRNHIPVISGNAVTQTGGIYTYDFSTGATQALGGVNGHKDLGSGVWGMFSGNSNGDYNVDDSDKDINWMDEVGLSGYLSSDVNMDKQSNNKDKNDMWQPNRTKGSYVPQ